MLLQRVSTRVRLQDCHEVTRLLGDLISVRRNGVMPMVQRLAETLVSWTQAAAVVSVVREGMPGQARWETLWSHAHGLSAEQRVALQEAVARGGDIAADPLSDLVFSQHGRLQTVTRAELLPDAIWDAHPHVERVRKPAGLGELMLTTLPASPGVLVALASHARWPGPGFTRRHQQMMALLQDGIGWLALDLSVVAADALGDRSTQLSPTGPRLTVREREVLVLLAKGNSGKEVASLLGLSHNTIHDHVKSLHRKLGVNTRGRLVRRYFELTSSPLGAEGGA